jgi:hypothetical protein
VSAASWRSDTKPRTTTRATSMSTPMIAFLRMYGCSSDTAWT